MEPLDPALFERADLLPVLAERDIGGLYRAQGRDLWTPTPADPFGDVDRPAALLEFERGRLDVAETLAVCPPTGAAAG
ncbi:MAG: hypothetical protein ACRDSL_04515 [Pseudonocardiaceae bacterium]